MNSGLQVFTEVGNIIQLDSNYNNFRLSRRIRVVGQYNSPALFVCQPNHLYAVTVAKYGQRAAIIPKFTTVNGVRREAYAVYGEALLYEFTQTKRNPSSSGIGMELYAEDGSVNYSSNDYNLKVIDYRSGSLTSTPINTVIQDTGNVMEIGEDTPRRMFIPGLIPIRYTGDAYQKRLDRYLTSLYQVSTLFFSRQLVTSWEGVYKVTYEPFYYQAPSTADAALGSNWANSSYRYSYLVIDTSTWNYGLPPIELYS
ncbi:hypothetical protein HXZ60_02270 [Acinetobacter towneri]|uniref:hypothetical protein n=1 Tax=Acinetobacter towneri TaxID=202956 RepID=UPI002575D0C2|nr:hypothetical protein [Acinetobacter towneri]MDM1282425.1 hypothetical protein [Acinetobacter towneri]